MHPAKDWLDSCALSQPPQNVHAGPRNVLGSALPQYLPRINLGGAYRRHARCEHRLLAFDGEHVTFSYKDYARGDQRRTMTLTAMEFLRRFVQHILPRGFVRIRQSGFLANTCRAARIAVARTLLTVPPTQAPSADAPATVTASTTTRPTWACPRCGAAMIVGPILSAPHLATVIWSFDSS
jgi:hypothetical protein